MLRVWYCDHFEVPLPPGHRFPMSKYRRLREVLLERGLVSADQLVASVPVQREVLGHAHDAEYLEAAFTGQFTDEQIRRLGFPWSDALLARSRASVFGTLAAARWALVHGVAGNLAGGTHHAHAAHGEGFCVFNDLAVTAKVLLAEKAVARVLVVDLDVHQGDGTASICAGDERVFTFSMHGAKNFPFRKVASTRDVDLADGISDQGYLEALETHLPEVLESCGPDLVLYQAGVDPLAEDTLGRLAVTAKGLQERDRLVFSLTRARGVPVVATLGGGYAKPLEATIDAHANTYAALNAVHGASAAARAG